MTEPKTLFRKLENLIHFWFLFWEKQSKAVIMLNRVMEKGTMKCHQYWPTIKEAVVTC